MLTLYDADNFYEHPSLKYLPDMNFAGLTVSFDVHYTGLRNLDSPRYPIIDWPYLDVIRADNTTAQVSLFNGATVVSGNWTPATAQFTVIDNGFRQWDHLTLWYLNQAFDYVVPQLVASYAFSPEGAGTVHYISIAGTQYSYTEQSGDQDVTIAQRLLEAVTAGASQYVTAVRTMNQVDLTAVKSDGQAIPTSASSNTAGQTIYAASAASIAAELARQCNAVDWQKAGADIPIGAQAQATTITFTATKPGVDGNALSMYRVISNGSNLTTDVQFRQFAGGNSDVTWHVSIDFSARNIPQVRRMWLTLAPPLSVGQPFTATEWEADFSNWTVSGPEDISKLQVAGPGSLHIDDRDSACVFSNGWTPEAGFYSQGYASVSKAKNNTVAIGYNSGLVHDLWIGTSLYSDRGSATIEIDGGPPIQFNTYLDTGNDPAVITRRQLASSVPPGHHTVLIRTNDDLKPFYFDCLDVVIPSDVPDAPALARTDISPALDYSTDHTYKLPPARILWMFDKLGFAGPVNQYIGVFWWNQRVRTGAQIPQATVTFDQNFQYGDQIWLTISGTSIGKSVLANDTNQTIAQHFACYVNATFVGLWAAANNNVLTMTCQSPTVNFQFDLTVNVQPTSGSTGKATVAGALRSSVTPLPVGEWKVDPSQSPPLNRAVRDWQTDLFNECKARNRELTVASSMELVQPPDGFPACYSNGSPVQTSVGYGSTWWSTQCAFNSAMLGFQQQVFDCIAGLMSAAGLAPSLQFGEFCWWYFSSGGSMAFYDADTQAAAQAALGRPLALFSGPDDDPNVNSGADATFLRNRLRDHVAALISFVRGKYPNAKFEVLFPYDVNYPQPVTTNNAGDKLGGKLLRFINFPVEWQTKQTAGFDRLKVEGLAFGSSSRDLNLARDVMDFPIQLGWPLDSVRYMLPIFNGGCPWIGEYRAARGLKIPVVNLWAFDHVCIFGLQVKEPAKPARSVRF